MHYRHIMDAHFVHSVLTAIHLKTWYKIIPVFIPHLQKRLWSGKPEAPTICPTM